MKNCLIILLLISLIDSTPVLAQTNEGTEFWFSFLEHRNPGLNTKVVMITSRVNTSGIVSAPLAGFVQSFTVNANDVTIIELPVYAETLGSETISNNGFKVTSRDLVSVYIHQYYEYRAEATVVLPVSTIDRSYYALSYEGYFTENQLFPSQVLFVASEDDTRIDITLSANTQGGRSRGSSFEITLDAGETYQIQGAMEADDFSGTYATGNKPFSLFCGNRYTALNCFRGGRDNLLEQAFPISTWGTQFVSVPFQPGIKDLYRILASENNTTAVVYFNDGSQQSYTLDAGEFAQFEDARISFIESDRAILIAQYMNQLDCGNGYNGDPSMLYLNSIFQIRDTVTLYNSSFQNIEDNFISLVFRTADLETIYFDGQLLSTIAPSIELAGRNKEFGTVILPVNTGPHTITTSGCGVIAKAYGLGNYESYAYSGGARFTKINASPIPDGGCLNDTVFFDTGLPQKRFDIAWVFEGGDTIREHSFTRIYEDLGTYPASLFVHDRCFDLYDTLSKNLLITLRESVDTDPFGQYCAGDEIRLSATDVPGATYVWAGPGGYKAMEQSPRIPAANPDATGPYEVIGIVSGCATFPAIVDITVRPNPQPDLGADAVFCPKGDVKPVISPGDFAFYEWPDGSTGPEFTVRDKGTYSVNVRDEFGCTAFDSITFVQQCPTAFFIPNIFSPNGDQVNDEFGIFGEDIIRFDLSVFSRWGDLLYHTTDAYDLWDGNLNGRKATTGVYAWLLNLEGYDEDGSVFARTFRGQVTLIR